MSGDVYRFQDQRAPSQLVRLHCPGLGAVLVVELEVGQAEEGEARRPRLQARIVLVRPSQPRAVLRDGELHRYGDGHTLGLGVPSNRPPA